MNADKSTMLLPLLLIIIGAGWLLTTLGVAPDINWIWTLSIVGIGLISFLIHGLDKVTVVVGPLFLTAGMLSVLRQAGRLSIDVEMPILVILSGILMMIARRPSIPVPSWFIVDPSNKK